jgi:hypothetical protein
MTTKVRSAFAIAAALVLTVILSPTSVTTMSSQESTVEFTLIREFDDCIQQRFQDIDKAFGFRRIIKKGDTPHRFKPENAKELTSVGKLKEAGITVALYLTSRSVLGEKPDKKEWNQDTPDNSPRGNLLTPPQYESHISRRLIKGPVSITGTEKGGLPLPSELWDQSRSAMAAFASKDSFQFSQGEWHFIARPVRATEQSCLGCHLDDTTRTIARGSGDENGKRLHIGDPLGVMLYAYRKAK